MSFAKQFGNDKKIINYDSYFSDIREKMLKGEKVSECRRCYADEDLGLPSMRTRSMLDFVNTPEEVEVRRSWPRRGPKGLLTDLVKPQLEYLEIESGRFCNLKCRTCGPGLSTSWDEDLNKSSEAVNNFYGTDLTWWRDVQEHETTNNTLSLLTYEDCKNLREIKVTGGEPFLTDTFLKFIENLVKWDIAKNIILDVFTNCSFFPKKKYLKALPYFRAVMLNLSLDAVEERSNFIRKKSKWELTLKVATGWKKLACNNKNIGIKISHTISVLNVLYFTEFCKWAHTFFANKSETGWDDVTNIQSLRSPDRISLIDHTIVYGPDYLSIRNFSDSKKEMILKNVYKQQKELIPWLKNKNKKIISDKVINVQAIDDIFSAIIIILKKKSNQSIEDTFLTKTEMFDNIRNENWRTVFPELAEIVDE